MDLALVGRKAIVTGGSLGIGKAVAKDLLAEGVDVVITAREARRLEGVAKELNGSKGRCIAIPGDLGTLEEIERVVKSAHQALGGRIDILVNNAGSTPMGRLDDTDDSTWMKSWNLKVIGYMRVARAVLPYMREAKWGRIINVIGRSAHQPRAIYMAGGAVNAALLNFTKALADEVAHDNILVTGVNPGPIDTPRLTTLINQWADNDDARVKFRDDQAASVALNRIGRADEVSGMVAFLCSERATYITGTCIDIDGGGTKCI